MSNSADLVGRLEAPRVGTPEALASCLDDLCQEAAAEIKRLREKSERGPVFDYLVGGDTSELARCQASEAYMSGALDRELEFHEETRQQLAASESKLREIEAETFAKCARIVEAERLHDNTGHPEDAAYNMALKHAAAAIRSQASQGPGK